MFYIKYNNYIHSNKKNDISELKLRFKNIIPTVLSEDLPKHYNIGDKIGQIMILPYPMIEFNEVNELSETDRGDGGFGSTGK